MKTIKDYIKNLKSEYAEESAAMKDVAGFSESPINKARHNTASEYCLRFVDELDKLLLQIEVISVK